MSDRPVVGFVILSHQDDDRLLRLVASLNREYDSPPVVVHHDFSQAPVDRTPFPSNCRFVEDWTRTSWANWSVVDGALRAYRSILARSNAEWVFLLSAADYPIRRGSDVRDELARERCDALIDMRPCLPGKRPRAQTIGKTNPVMSFMDTPGNHALKTRFTMSPQLWFPIVRRKPRWRVGRLTYRPPFAGRHPFTEERPAFYGDHWWAGNRRAVEAVLDPGGFAARLRRHLRMRTQPDESYYCTVLAAREDMTLSLDNRRFAEWNGGGAHPQSLTEADLDAMFASGAYFARKFEAGSSVRDHIDARLART